jgi:hypothetical protein
VAVLASTVPRCQSKAAQQKDCFSNTRRCSRTRRMPSEIAVLDSPAVAQDIWMERYNISVLVGGRQSSLFYHESSSQYGLWHSAKPGRGHLVTRSVPVPEQVM